MNVIIMSRSRAKKYTHQDHSEQSVVISINNLGDVPASIHGNRSNGIHDVLRVFFDDVDSGESSISVTDAMKIAEFVHRYQHTGIDRIIVHCEAGRSRSAGVGAAILKYLYDDDTGVFDDPKYRPNMLCYRRVLWALNLGGDSNE